MDSERAKRVTISWSGGKDSALALYRVLRNPAFEVIGLHTVFNAENRRVGLHGIREALIDRQARAIGLPLTKLYLGSSDDHEAYRKLMTDHYAECARENIDGVVFGDIFLEDLKNFRDELLLESGLTGIYPLWKCQSDALLRQFLDAGFKTIICACNQQVLAGGFSGKILTKELMMNFPKEVDVCGENGEFHTFVFDGPIFRERVAFSLGDTVNKTYSYKIRDERGAERTLTSEFLFQELL